MANAKKRKKFEEMNFEAYLKRVDSGEEAGQFEDGVDIIDINHAADPLTLKYREREPFVFNALLFEGMQTGYARCSIERCRERMKRDEGKVVFQCQEYNRNGLQRRFLERHLTVYHKTEQELEAQKRKRRRPSAPHPSQERMTTFLQPKKKQISHANKEKLKTLNAAVIASNNLSLNFFVSEEMIERDRFLLEAAEIDPDQVYHFNRGETAVKEDLFKVGNANRQLIKSVAPQLAEKSRLSWIMDHQSILQLTNEPSRHALGIGLLLAATDGKRYPFLLSYESVESVRIEETVRVGKNVAKERFKIK